MWVSCRAIHMKREVLGDSENLVVISGNPRSGNGVKLESTSLELRKFIALCFLQSSYDIFNAS